MGAESQVELEAVVVEPKAVVFAAEGQAELVAELVERAAVV